MSTSTLQNFRVGSDITVKIRLKDGGVAIDWSTLSGIRAVLYSDAQSSIAGRCDVTVDGEDPTLLVCRYAATKMQYLGVNRIVVSAKYMGMTKTYDKPAFTFVRWTEDQAGEEIAIEDPEVTVEISVEDISSSILQEAVNAAFSAADRAEAAAEAAEHMVDIKTGPAGKSPYKGENGNWFEWDEEAGQYVDTGVRAKGETGDTPDISIGTVTTVEPGEPAAASMSGTPEAPVLNLSIPKGVVGDTPNITVGTVTTGEPGTPVVVTLTGTPEAPVLNVQIPQGAQGNTGSSVAYPFELVNNLTTDDATKALTAAQGKVLDGKISQLEAKVDDLSTGKYYGYYATASDLPEDVTVDGFAYVGEGTTYTIYNLRGGVWTSSDITVNQSPIGNDEDIDQNEDGKLQFANRVYNAQQPNGKGYVILRKNKTFASQVTDTNTIYEIRYEFDLDGASVTIPAGCELRFVGGLINGSGGIVGTNTIINSEDKCFDKNVALSGTWANDMVFTKWFAFISADDGVTDNSLCFKQLQAVINGTKGCRVEFEQGFYQTQIIGMEPEGYVEVDGVTYPKWAMNTYQVDRRVVLNIFELPHLEINLNGSTIKAINITCPGWNMIRLNGVKYGYVHDGTLIGMADGFDYPQYVNYANTVTNDYEFSTLFYQVGGRCNVNNLTCKYATGDGMAVGSGDWYFRTGDIRPSGVVSANGVVNFPAEGYSVVDCEVCYCGRNGITLHSSEDGKLQNCHIHHIGSDAGSGNIGSDGIQGRNPRAGIDVEFEDGQGLMPIMQWDGLYIHDCGGKSYGFTSPSQSRMKQFSARNCRFIRLGVNNNLTADGPKEFVGCYYEHNGGEGSLYGNGISYRDCTIVLKAPELNLGASEFNNCVITDEIPDESMGNNYVFTETHTATIFRNSILTIKHTYGCLQDKTFYNCVLNFYFNGRINAAGIECYDCEFHNDPEDETDKSFNFFYGNNHELTRGHFLFVRCTFERLTYVDTSINGYAFSAGKYPVVVDGCKFQKLEFYNGSVAKDVTLKNCTIDYIYISSYQDNVEDVKAVKIDNCIISDYNSGSARNIPIEVSNSKVEVSVKRDNKLQKVNFTKCEIINSITRQSYYPDVDVNAVDSILNFVTSTATTAFNLVRCYIKGLVTEASFQGTKKDCTFEIPFAKSGATADRPTASSVGAGFTYFDTDLGKMIVSNGTDWVNMDGTALS